MYKLIAIDIDGTLLNNQRELTLKTIQSITEARRRGVKVILASGRPIAGMRKHLNTLGMTTNHDYVIHFNGAILENAHSGEILHSEILSGSDAKHIANIAEEMNINSHAFSQSLGLITPKTSKYTNKEATINEIDIHEMNFSQLENDHHIIKAMMVGDASALDEVEKHLSVELFDKYTIVRSADYFLEFLNLKSNKGLAVKKLAEILNISREDIMCIGDAENDRHMVEFAGLGVAMGNAMKGTKQAADHITDTNDNDGVAKAIDQFILNG